MKFTFEADMQKGKCSACPFLATKGSPDRWWGWWNWSCALTKKTTALEVEPDECPLKEANEVVWHPYPKEKPTEDDEYLVTVSDSEGSYIDLWNYFVGGEFRKLGHPFFPREPHVIAWAEMPKPYEETQK